MTCVSKLPKTGSLERPPAHVCGPLVRALSKAAPDKKAKEACDRGTSQQCSNTLNLFLQELELSVTEMPAASQCTLWTKVTFLPQSRVGSVEFHHLGVVEPTTVPRSPEVLSKVPAGPQDRTTRSPHRRLGLNPRWRSAIHDNRSCAPAECRAFLQCTWSSHHCRACSPPEACDSRWCRSPPQCGACLGIHGVVRG